jgi:hypothetical protein
LIVRFPTRDVKAEDPSPPSGEEERIVGVAAFVGVNAVTTISSTLPDLR